MRRTVPIRPLCTKGHNCGCQGKVCLSHQEFSVEGLWWQSDVLSCLYRYMWYTVSRALFRKRELGHFLRGRSLKGRCNIRVYVPVRVPVCPSSPPPWPRPYCGAEQQNSPHIRTWPLTPVPATVPASKCTTYPWEELPLKKCPKNTLSSAANSASSATWNSVSLPWHTILLGRELSSLPRTRWGPNSSLSSVFETVLSATVFALFPELWLFMSLHDDCKTIRTQARACRKASQNLCVCVMKFGCVIAQAF